MKNMKKSIVIGSLLAALLLISIPFASAIQMQPLSEEIKNNPNEQHIYTPSDEEIEELITAIQDVIDFLESIGYEGEVIQKLQYFINNVYNFRGQGLLCDLFFISVILYLAKLIKNLVERDQTELAAILLCLYVPIFALYIRFCGKEDDFLYSLNDILEGGNSDASCGCESMEPEGFNNQNSQSQQSNPQQIILRGLPTNN